MARRPKSFWYSVALLVASTVGIGLFGIPHAVARAGFGVGLAFLFGLSAIMLLGNLLYGEIILRTHERHQFVGYVRKYLGPWARRFNLFTFWISMYGAYIGILIINGTFLSKLLGFAGWEVSPVILSSCFMVIATLLVYAGLKTVSHVDLVVTGLALVLVGIIGIVGASHIQSYNYDFSILPQWLLPFGVILFSLNGIQGVPLVRETLIGKEQYYRRALIYGTLIPAVVYLVFMVVVVGVTGIHTSPEAISGLAPILGKRVVIIGSLFGFLTSSTIFLSLVSAFRASLREDFRLRRRGDFILPLLPAFILFLLGVQNFIEIIGLVGGVAVSIDTMLLFFMYEKVREKGDRIPEYSLDVPPVLIYLLMGVFILGAILTIV